MRRSNAVKKIPAKFLHLFEGPFKTSKILNHSAYKPKAERGKIRGEFNGRR